MARTFIGQLILRLRAEGLGEAKRVENAVSQIERSARRLASAPWGANFQRQLDKLGVSTQQIHAVRQSWNRLHEDMNRRGLSDAMKKSDIAAWKTATLGHFSAVRSGFDETERRAKRFSQNLQAALRPAMVAMGFYTGIYGAGILGREALTASSERRREVFRFQMANVPESDQDMLFEKSEELGTKYPSIPVTGIMEMARHAYSLMGDAERGSAVLERMVQSFVTLQSVKGVDAAIQQLTGLLRGMDNLGVNKDGQKGIDQVNELIDAATRAAQVDPDFDPGTFFSFARRSKVAGPALSPDFLARASVFMQDMGPDTAGNALGMAFKAFVLEAVGSAGGKKYLKERDRLGIRKDGKLLDAELFGSDPDEWVVKHLIPALERDGVDMANETAIATAIGKLSGNTNATGLLTRIVTQREQIERWLRLMDNAVGTEVAADVRHNDPFVAWESFKKSLENLSAEVLPIDSIASGLNSLADTINRFKAAVKEGDPRVVNTALGAGALGAAWLTWKIAAGIWGLITAGAALNSAAVSLHAAAVSLGGAGGADILTDGKPKKKPGSFWGMLLTRAPWIAALLTSGSTADNEYTNASAEERQRMRDEARLAAEAYNLKQSQKADADNEARNKQAELDREQSLDSYLDGPPKPVFSEVEIYNRVLADETTAAPPATVAPSAEAPRQALPPGALPDEAPRPTPRFSDSPVVSATPPNVPPIASETGGTAMGTQRPRIDSGEMEAALEEMKILAENAGRSVTQSLSVSARPNVDTGPVDTLIEKLRTAIGLLSTLGSTAAAAQSNTEADLRRIYSDYGVAP